MMIKTQDIGQDNCGSATIVSVMAERRSFSVRRCEDGVQRVVVEHVFRMEDHMEAIQEEFPWIGITFLRQEISKESVHDSPFSSAAEFIHDVFLGSDGKEYRFKLGAISTG